MGIVTGLFIKPSAVAEIIALSVSASGLILSALFNNRISNVFYGISFSLAVYILGLLMYTRERSAFTVLKPERAVYAGVAEDYPAERRNSFMITIKLNNRISGSDAEPVKGSLVIYHSRDSGMPQVSPGDLILFSCDPVPISARGNPFEFNYRFWMESHGIRYYSFTRGGDILSVKAPEHRSLRHKALVIRNRIISMYEERGIEGKSLALVSALVLGEKSSLDEEQKENYIKAGVMHIMAVSGLHAVILSIFVFNILFFLKKRFNYARIAITILFLWSFAFVTGLTPSVMRATLMFSFLHAGKLLKRPVSNINSILASAFVLILIRPSVIFDAGFLLSYSAVVFIIAFYREIYNLLSFKSRLADYAWQSASVTLAAQAGTLGLTIMMFNRFPVWFIITNVIIVPVSSLAIIVGCLVPLTYPVEFLSEFAAMLLGKLIWLTEELTALAASLPLSTIEDIGFTLPECLLLISALSLTGFFILKKPRIRAAYPLAAFLLFVAAGTVRHGVTAAGDQLIVYNIPGKTVIAVRTGRTLNLYSNDGVIPGEVTRHKSALGLRLEMNMITGRPMLIKAGASTILLTDSLNLGFTRDEPPDFVVLTGRNPFPGKHLPAAVRAAGTVIISEAHPGYRLAPSDGSPIAGEIWNVRKQGAFSRRL